jgi:hypothetical protein
MQLRFPSDFPTLLRSETLGGMAASFVGRRSRPLTQNMPKTGSSETRVILGRTVLERRKDDAEESSYGRADRGGVAAMARGEKVADICRKVGISEGTYYAWKSASRCTPDQILRKVARRFYLAPRRDGGGPGADRIVCLERLPSRLSIEGNRFRTMRLLSLGI